MKPVVAKTIPTQVVNEQASYGPFDLKEYIKPADDSLLSFQAELMNGDALPKGLICTSDGIITGIPAKGTQGNYEIKISAQTIHGEFTETVFLFAIKPSLVEAEADRPDYLDKIKAQVWEAVEHNLPIPDLTEMYSHNITELEIYHLLERWGILIVWDAYNLEPASSKILLNLEGTSKYYNVYDRGSSIVAAPKDLFSHERTILDGLETSRAVAREIYKRGWTIQFAGFDKLIRAAWVELQHLSDKHGKQIEIINYTPRLADIKLYKNEALDFALKQQNRPD